MAATWNVRHGVAGLVLVCMAVPGVVAARPAEKSEHNAVVDVIDRIKAKDCAGAIQALNAGLATNSPKVALLAGNMYEQGICLKPNLDRAAGYYITAHNGGERAGAYRLAAAYASRDAGPDTAAALWWLHKADGAYGKETCAVEAAAADDPDRFVAALQTWTPARLAGCNYLAGVVATVAGEVQYPKSPRQLEPEGTVMVRFTPALGKIDIWTLASAGVFSEAKPDSEKYKQPAVRASRFESVVKEIADRALVRYPRPSGLDPAWVQEFAMVFDVSPY